MAWKVLDADYRSDEINKGLGSVGSWGLLYNPDTGDYKVVSKGVIPGMDPWNQPLQTVIYENGAYYIGAISNPDFFPDRDVNNPTELASDFSIDIRRKVKAAHTTMGGNAAGSNINQTATNPTGPFNGNATWSSSAQPGISSAIPGVGPILSLPPTGPQIDPLTGQPVYSTIRPHVQIAIILTENKSQLPWVMGESVLAYHSDDRIHNFAVVFVEI